METRALRNRRRSAVPAAGVAAAPVAVLVGVTVFAWITLFANLAHGQEATDSAPTLRLGPLVQASADRPHIPHVEPFVAAHPEDARRLLGASIVVSGQGGLNNAELRSDGFLSVDGGLTWQRFPLAGCGTDPWAAFGPEGEAYIACHDERQVDGKTRTGVIVHRSDDGGETWHEPVQVPLGSGRSVDQPKLAVDHSEGPRRGTVYVAVGQWMPAPGQEGYVFATVVSRSVDRGRNFSEPVMLRNSRLDQQPVSLGVGNDGSLVVSFMDYAANGSLLRHRRSWTARSKDGGLSFTLPALITEHLSNELPWAVAVDPSRQKPGRLYAALDGHWVRGNSSPDPGSPPDLAPLSLLSSADGGLGWSRPIAISDASHASNAETPAVAVNAGGTIGVAWYDTRFDPQGWCFDLYFSASIDGGQSFTENLRLTPETSCPRENPKQMGVARRWAFGGDYSGLAATADGAFQVFWADSRSGTYQLWSARVEVVSGEAGSAARALSDTPEDQG